MLMGRRLLILLVTALVLVGLFFLIRPRLPGGAAESRTIPVTIRAGAMTPTEIAVTAGDGVTLAITSDRARDFHLHGYDLERQLEPGVATTLTFPATLTGRFAIEDEGASAALGALIVGPRGGR